MSLPLIWDMPVISTYRRLACDVLAELSLPPSLTDAPSIRSRSRSAWPQWRIYSSIMWTSTEVDARLGNGLDDGVGRVKAVCAAVVIRCLCRPVPLGQRLVPVAW